MVKAKAKKKDKFEECPYRDIEVIVGTSVTCYCSIPGKDKCISQERDPTKFDYTECSYYLFPDPLCRNYQKGICKLCPCERSDFIEKEEVSQWELE